MYKNPVFWLEVVSALLDVTSHDQVAIIVDAVTIIAMFVGKYKAVKQLKLCSNPDALRVCRVG